MNRGTAGVGGSGRFISPSRLERMCVRLRPNDEGEEHDCSPGLYEPPSLQLVIAARLIVHVLPAMLPSSPSYHAALERCGTSSDKPTQRTAATVIAKRRLFEDRCSLSVDDCCHILGCTPDKVVKAVKAGGIAHRVVARRPLQPKTQKYLCATDYAVLSQRLFGTTKLAGICRMVMVQDRAASHKERFKQAYYPLACAGDSCRPRRRPRSPETLLEGPD